MKKIIVVSLEHRFFRVDGRVYTSLAFDYAYWGDYLREFDLVTVFARVKDVDSVLPSFRIADGTGVQFSAAKYYIGPVDFVLSLPKLLRQALALARTQQYFLLRSGNVSNVLWVALSVFGRPYLREFPGNIEEGISHFVGDRARKWRFKALAILSDRVAKVQAKRAAACSYVSESVRDLYPSGRPFREFVFSSVRLPDLRHSKEQYTVDLRDFRVISVGRIENEKGHRFLIEALALLLEAHVCQRVTLTIIGDGSRLEEMRALANQRGVTFNALGAITAPDSLFCHFSEHDIFVLPSLTEGMPRALIEALALGMPAVASAVGGVPEILNDEDMVEPGSSTALAEALIRSIKAPATVRKRAAEDYLFKIRERYSTESMKAKKSHFWSMLDAPAHK